MKKVNDLLRSHLRDFLPYSTARDEFKGKEGVFLDANENSLGSVHQRPWNRYPDPRQHKLKVELGIIKGIQPGQIFIGNGSDDHIDLLIRAFCEPGIDQIMIVPPTYGMYKVSANLNNVGVIEVLLTEDFQLDVPKIVAALNERVKIIFICSPNNPTGNLMVREDIFVILNHFHGLVVIDEAYIDFSGANSWINDLTMFPKLVVLQTLSKAWGLAALRLGMLFASLEMVKVMNLIKPPYNISGLVQNEALAALAKIELKDRFVQQINVLKQSLERSLRSFALTIEIYPSDANFLLVKFKKSAEIFHYLISQNIILRDRSQLVLCQGCVRITVGTEDENKQLMAALNNYLKG